MSVITDLLQHLKNIGRALAGVEASLKHAQAQWQTHHDRAHKAHAKEIEARKAADQARKLKQFGKAAILDRHAQEAHAHARKNHAAAVADLQVAKQLNQRSKGLAVTQAELEAKLKAAKQKASRVTVSGNKVSGGSAPKRLQVCMLTSAHWCALGKRSNFYSQSGGWDVDHCITGPAHDKRDDCSSWATSVFKSCDLPDPNGDDYHGGYTGTLGTHGKRISRDVARRTPGARVLFGTAPFHHVELALGDGTEHTIGHGSAPVDMGTFDLLPGPVTFVA